MASRLLLALLALTALASGCAVEQPSGEPPVDLVTEEITLVAVDGRVRVVVKARERAEGLVVELDTAALEGKAQSRRADRRCLREDQVLTCKLGDLDAGSERRLTLVNVSPLPGTGDAEVELPVTVRTRTSEPKTERVALRFVTGPELVTSDEPDQEPDEVRPAVLNVGADPAEGVHVVVTGPEGTRFASSYSNCRPVLPDERVVVCTFEQVVAPGEAMRVAEPLVFDGTPSAGAAAEYDAGVGAMDPEGLGELGPAPDGTAPELLLEPTDADAFGSEIDGVGTGW